MECVRMIEEGRHFLYDDSGRSASATCPRRANFILVAWAAALRHLTAAAQGGRDRAADDAVRHGVALRVTVGTPQREPPAREGAQDGAGEGARVIGPAAVVGVGLLGGSVALARARAVWRARSSADGRAAAASAAPDALPARWGADVGDEGPAGAPQIDSSAFRREHGAATTQSARPHPPRPSWRCDPPCRAQRPSSRCRSRPTPTISRATPPARAPGRPSRPGGRRRRRPAGRSRGRLPSTVLSAFTSRGSLGACPRWTRSADSMPNAVIGRTITPSLSSRW